MTEQTKQFFEDIVPIGFMAIIIIGFLGAMWETGVWGMILSVLIALFIIKGYKGL